jgi:hypothetical protein
MDSNKQIDVLLAEYNRMTAEIRMYVQEYSPRFNIFGAIGLGAIAFAWKEPKYEIVFAIIPYLIMLVGSVTAAQAYIISCLALRIRDIEDEIEKVNGAPLLQWESRYATAFVFSPILRARNGRVLSPIVVSLALVVVTIGAILAFCVWRAYDVLQAPWGLIYVVVTSSVFALLVGCALSFFRVGNGLLVSQRAERANPESCVTRSRHTTVVEQARE